MKTVLAVSGGVDSVVLLDLLAKHHSNKDKLVVTHFDHGIRADSAKDTDLVRSLAKKYQLVFETKREDLGEDCSEDAARIRRQIFLEEVRQKHGAKYIMTAHHQDDRIETAIINLIRGTNRLGLTSLNNDGIYKRPLLLMTKDSITEYANMNNLKWREDSTNKDTSYLRNYVRLALIPKMSSKDPQIKDKLLNLIGNTHSINKEVQAIFEKYEIREMTSGSIEISRYKLIMLPNTVCAELLLFIIKQHHVQLQINSDKVKEMVIFIKTAKPDKKFEINKNVWITSDNTVIKINMSV